MLPRRLVRLARLAPFAALACSGATRGTFVVYADGGDDGATDAAASGQEAGGAGSCTALSCFLGCCQGGKCVTPGTDTACGALGGACRDCTAQGQRCQIGACSGGGGGGGADAGSG